MAAAGVIIKYGKTVLLCKRSNICNFAGYWSIPAGAIEEGEMPFVAAERELFEETKIKIKTPLSFVMKTDGMRSERREKEPFYIYEYNEANYLTDINGNSMIDSIKYISFNENIIGNNKIIGGNII